VQEADGAEVAVEADALWATAVRCAGLAGSVRCNMQAQIWAQLSQWRAQKWEAPSGTISNRDGGADCKPKPSVFHVENNRTHCIHRTHMAAYGG